jgi:A/G-specific adenine glycosylase
MRKLHQELLEWYQKYGREDLPWRKTDNIYHIYLSEVMLQQTQVSRVASEYYPKFLELYPTLQSLADATEAEILANWSGLGYYSRARNLHKFAKVVQDTIPNNEKELIKLPGIGRYTASAICSFGYHQKIPVVDTNIARVIKRYFALFEQKENVIWEYAKEFLNKEEPTKHNLALMDLGSMICTPKNPKCDECPLNKNCQGINEPELYTKKKKTEYIPMELFYGILVDKNSLGLVKASGNMYKNMLELPTVDPIEENYIGSFKHSYTKYKLDVKLYKIEDKRKDMFWVDFEDIDRYPISSLTKKAMRFIANKI